MKIDFKSDTAYDMRLRCETVRNRVRVYVEGRQVGYLRPAMGDNDLWVFDAITPLGHFELASVLEKVEEKYGNPPVNTSQPPRVPEEELEEDDDD